MRIYVFCLAIISCILYIKCGHHENPKGSLTLDKNLELAWRINSTKGTIRFTVKAQIFENGWVLIGFTPRANGTKKISLHDVNGEAFIVWKGSRSKKFGWHISECSVAKGILYKDKDHSAHYHLGSSSYNTKTQTLTAVVWRPLKSKNSKDLEIKHGFKLVIFGSFGNDGSKKMRWKQRIKKLNDGEVGDALKVTENVDLFHFKSEDHKGNSKGYAAKIAEKHWLGVVVGVSAFLTILITVTVYCLTKKKQKEFKRVVSMPFHKNTDYDDEAKVAFLQSEET